MELSKALIDFNNMETTINEKLSMLNEKLSGVSLTDISGLNEVLNELKQLSEVEWKEMENKYQWILTAPNIITDNYLERNVRFFQFIFFNPILIILKLHSLLIIEKL